MALLSHGLLPASFRGAPFAVEGSGLGGGRRIALHQYPGRDEPWAEDMGRDARRYSFRGFIVDGDVLFAGGPIQLQRALLIAALEKEGSGTLTHPTLGVLNGSVTNFDIGEELEAGTMSAVKIEFVESGKKNIASLLSTSSGLLSASNLCTAALAVDGLRAIALGYQAGNRQDDLTITAQAWSDQATTLGGDATALHRMTAQLAGSYGRYSAGANSGLYGQVAQYPEGTAISTLVASASASRAAISEAASDLVDAAASANLLYAANVAAAATALVQALASACADPADALRLLEDLIGFAPLGPQAATQMGAGLNAMLRRAAAASLTAAVAGYQPSSADEASALITHLGIVIDALAVEAADGGDRASYRALRDAMGAIVTDLRARGATLSQITTISTARPLPAVVIAQRQYRDASRAPQLVGQANPVSPLFMPTSFPALAA